ncbi:MAG: SEC-C domain-containing protein, partial [Candidatus Lambdaproteobacteria bacterium]|nr:SEC-C domain-containing protein [Candidatus Lambdaproteobacteria bacterium]
PFYFAIVDEVDSILIDEARTPLIISGPTDESTDKYFQIQRLIGGLSREIRKEEVAKLAPEETHGIREDWAQLEEREVVRVGDYFHDERSRSIGLTEQGGHALEGRLRKAGLLEQGGLFDFENMTVLHHTNQALKANYMFRRDVDYVVHDGKVVIVDEFTGRLMPGRRFSDGLHQALEAKEGVTIERESQTYATITFQNYFRMYEKLAGMTGTAKTEEEEFQKIYNMPVAVVPTNQPMIREDLADVIYKTKDGKLKAILEEIEDIHETGQPILVGTISIEASELLSRRLKATSVAHTVLNAKYHEQEAEIIAHAGEEGRVTIATNMAGRGTDIKLGPGVAERGGLFILGTERHESRRIDNQLRGRSGRQGDRGASRFFLSLEDDLMRIFGGERIANLMTRLKVEDDEAITHVLISRAIEGAQKKVEMHHFEMRKHVLEYDDVMNKQREIIYGQRKEILGGDVGAVLLEMAEETLDEMVGLHLADKHVDQWDLEGFKTQFEATFAAPPQVDWEAHDLATETLVERLMPQVEALHQDKREMIRRVMQHTSGVAPGPEEVERAFADFERQVLLSIVDAQWKDHLLSMDHLREGIGLVGYAQKKPIDEYKREAFRMFSELMTRISREASTFFFRTHFAAEAPRPVERKAPALSYTHGEETEAAPRKPAIRVRPKIGRNDPCPCGSGKKYKQCHLAQDQAQAQQLRQAAN